LLRARTRLRAFGAAAATPYHGQALALQRAVEQRMRTLLLWALALALVLIGGALWWRRRRYGGSDRWDLLERAPEATSELTHLLSAIAHEVLKHNTLMLGGLCAQLEAGAAVGASASTLDRALFGADGKSGAAARLDAYVEQLRLLGRTHGQRLNLRRRDAAISALCDGFAELRALRPRLLRIDRAGRFARARVLARLREATALLNEDAEQALRALLDEARVVVVDEVLLRRIFDRTAREPALSRHEVSPLAIDPAARLPLSLSLPRQAFDEIVANLFRNALQASARSAPPAQPLAVGLAAELEVDPITGLSCARLSIRDRAQAELSRQQLRGGGIESGLGLTADLVNRYNGSLDVRADEPGWAKAVLLTLPASNE
jgi:hypothetical protein